MVIRSRYRVPRQGGAVGREGGEWGMRQAGIVAGLAFGLAMGPAADVRADMTTTAAQYLLREAHLYRGPLDGDAGPETRAAIQAFQQANGLEATGALDERTLGVLRLRQAPRGVGVGRSLRAALREGFERSLLVPDWSSVRNLHAFHFAFEDYGIRWSYVHVCGDAVFPGSGFGVDRSVSFMMDLVLEDDATEPPIAALLRGDYALSDLWTAEYIFVEPFCRLRVSSAVALGVVR